MSRGGVGAVHQSIELVQIALGNIPRSGWIGIRHGQGDDATLLVVHDLCLAGEVFRGVDAVSLVIEVLQVEAVDQVAAYSAAPQQVDEQRGVPSSAEESTCEG